MTNGDWIFYYATEAVKWLEPAVFLVGLGIAAWAFHRCRKCAYLVLAAYFAFASFSLLAMPSINRAIRVRRAPDVSAQTQQKIDAAVRETIHRVLVEEGHSEGVPDRRNIDVPLGLILLVTGLWLLARRETPRTDSAGDKKEMQTEDTGKRKKLNHEN